MPEFLTAVIAYIGAEIGSDIGATLIMYASEIATTAIVVSTIAFSYAQASAARRRAKDALNASQVDRLVNVVSTVAPRELVMGRVRKGGVVFFKGSAGATKETFCMAIALAGHEIDAVEQIYLNDVLVTLDGSGNVTSAPYTMARTGNAAAAADPFTGAVTLAFTPVAGTVKAYTLSSFGGAAGVDTTEVAITLVSGLNYTTTPGATVQYQYSSTPPKAKIWWYLGTSTQTADARLIALFPTLWTSAHRARGVAYLVCEFTYDETAFPSGLPNVTALVRGAKIYDPRTTTTVWTENPALMCRHVMLHPQFGKRASLTAAEDARITAAANACDVGTVYTVGGVAQASRALYKAAIVVPYGGTARDALDDLVQAMAGQWAYAAGEYYLRAGAYTASVLSLTDADLAVVSRGSDGAASQRQITITTHKARDQQFNVVVPTIWDDAQDYKQSALTPLKSTTLITRDGAELVQNVNMPAVAYAPQALNIAGIMMRDARDPLSVVLPFKLTAYRAELFDTISLTISRYGWSSKTFMVMGREWTGDGSLRLTLKENVASIYTMDANFSAQGGADNTSLPSPWVVPTVGTLTVTSGPQEALQQPDGTFQTRMRVTWPALTDLAALNGTVEVQYRSAVETGEWKSAVVTGGETQIVVGDVTAGTHYVVRARAKTTVAVGDWSAQVVHQVAGRGAVVADFTMHPLWGAGGSVKTNCVVVGTILEASDTTTWATLPATWTLWTRWNVAPASSMVYLDMLRSLLGEFTGVVQVEYDADGDVLVEVAWATDANLFTSGFGVYQSPDIQITAKYIKVRLTVTANAAHPVPCVRTCSYAFYAPNRTQRWYALDISTLAGTSRITVGDVRLPLSSAFNTITFASAVVTDTRQGAWTVAFLDKDAVLGPRVQFRLNGALADPAAVDAQIEGV